MVRLARFNLEQGGEAKRYFHGLPSPAAGMTLATYFPFSQTALYEQYLSDLPWAQIIGIGTILISVLAVSHVPYARMPRIGLRTAKGITTTVMVLAALYAALVFPQYYFFPALMLYLAWGLIKSLLLGLLDRMPGGDPLLDVDEENDLDDRAEVRTLDYGDLGPRGPRPTGPRLEDTTPMEDQA